MWEYPFQFSYEKGAGAAPGRWTALTKGTRVACDGLEGRRSVLVNQAFYERARNRKPVEVNE